MGSKTAAPRWDEHYGVARAIVMFGCPREERCSGRGYEMIYLFVCCSIRDGLLHHRRTHTHTLMQIRLVHSLGHPEPECRCKGCRTALRAHGKRCHHPRTDAHTYKTQQTIDSKQPEPYGRGFDVE